MYTPKVVRNTLLRILLKDFQTVFYSGNPRVTGMPNQAAGDGGDGTAPVNDGAVTEVVAEFDAFGVSNRVEVSFNTISHPISPGEVDMQPPPAPATPANALPVQGGGGGAGPVRQLAAPAAGGGGDGEMTTETAVTAETDGEARRRQLQEEKLQLCDVCSSFLAPWWCVAL